MEATCSSLTSVDFQRSTRSYIPEDRTLHNRHCENLTSYKLHIDVCLSNYHIDGVHDLKIIIIEFSSLFIYVLSSTSSGQLQSQHEFETTTKTNTCRGQKQTNKKLNQLQLFTLRYVLLKISCHFTNCMNSRSTSSLSTVTGGATERRESTCVPRRNANPEWGTIFSAIKASH
jgi:hypothetical protein